MNFERPYNLLQALTKPANRIRNQIENYAIYTRINQRNFNNDQQSSWRREALVLFNSRK